MCVVPESAGRMVLGNVDLVGKLRLRGNVQQDVVAVTCRRDVQSVRVQVNGVEASHARRQAETIGRVGQASRVLFGQIVDQVDA